MKKIIFSLAFILILHCTLNIENCSAQWQPDVRLTNDPALSYTSNNNAWCIAVSGNVVHVVWYDNRAGNYEIYYKRSTNGGTNWGADTRLTNNTADSYVPSISVSGSVVHVVWQDNRDGHEEIYYKRSTDAGLNWGADTRLTNSTEGSYGPSLSVSGSVVHVVWYKNITGSGKYYKRSTDAGISWGVDTPLTNNSLGSGLPSVAVSGSVVHVVWHDSRDGNNEIYYKRSTDAGLSWGVDTRLTSNIASSERPSVSVSGQAVHVVWGDYRDGNWEIYYKRSTDGGSNWGTDTRVMDLNYAVSESPSVSVSDSSVHVVWRDDRNGNWEIYYIRSISGGAWWDLYTRLTINPSNSFNPSVSISGSVVHVVWCDNRDGNHEIYYKRDPTGNPTGIINISTEIPSSYSLEQNYPNPFNPSTNIRYQITNDKLVMFKIFDIMGREVETLVNEKQSAGTYEVTFDASKYSSGIYFYRLITDGFSETKKMVLFK